LIREDFWDELHRRTQARNIAARDLAILQDGPLADNRTVKRRLERKLSSTQAKVDEARRMVELAILEAAKRTEETDVI